MTIIATTETDEAMAELIVIADMLDETGWRWIPSGETPNMYFPEYKCMLVKPSRRISIVKQGTAQCRFTLEVDGSPTIALEIQLPVPRGKCDAVHQGVLRTWASGICRDVVASDRDTPEAATTRLTEIGHVMVSLTGISSELHPTFGLSWQPPTPWSAASIGDALRLKAIPPGFVDLLAEKASCLRHVVGNGSPVTPTPRTHKLSRLDLSLDFEDRPSMARILRLVAELGISPDDVRFPTCIDDSREDPA